MPFLTSLMSIVATGPSAVECGAETAPGTVIAVNSAMEYFRFDIGLTMDGIYSVENLPRVMQHHPTNSYFVRQSAFVHMVDAHESRPWGDIPLVVYNCDVDCTDFHRSTDVIKKRPARHVILNGDNSGYNALALAARFKPQTLLLYGYDLTADLGHFFDDYPWHGKGSKNTHAKFAKWRQDMHAARRQFDAIGTRVINMNPKSAIDAFERV